MIKFKQSTAIRLRSHFAALLATASVVSGPLAHAAVVSFDGNGASATVLSTAANWDTNNNPTTNDQATFTDAAFGAALPATLTNGANQTWGNLIWDSASTTNLTGNAITLSVLGGNANGDLITLTSTKTGGSLNWGFTGTSSFITATTGNFNVVSSGATLNMSSQFEFNSAVTNQVLTKTGAGVMSFNNGNNGNGSSGAGAKFILDGGTLNFATTTGFGAFGSGTVVLEIHDGTSLDAAGAGFDITLNKNNTETWAGDFTFKGSSKNLNLGTGAVTMTGGTRQVTVNALTLTVGGVIGDGNNAYGLTKAGAGTLVLSGVNTYTGTTTINVGTLTLNGAGALSTSSAVVDNGTLQINRSNAVIQGTDFSGDAITGTGKLTELGGATGSLTLNAANSYSGTTTLTSGTLTLAGSNSSAGQTTVTAGTLNLASATNGGLATGQINFNGGTIRSNNATARVTTDALFLNGTGTIGANANLTFGAMTVNGGDRTMVVNNDVTAVSSIGQDATRAFTKQGTGALTVSGNTTYTGATQIDAGILAVAGTFGTGGNLKLNGGVLGMNGSYTKTIGTSAGRVQFLTAGTGGGFAAYGSNATWENAANNLAVRLNNNITPLIWGTNGATTGTTNFLSATAPLILGSTVSNGTVDFQNYLDLNGLAHTVQVDRSSVAGAGTDAIISGIISSSQAGDSLTKSGAGILSLNNTNTYTGDTLVNAGTLIVSGSISNSAVTVNGGKLAGNGTVGSLTVNSTGEVSPGLSPGSLNVNGTLTMNTGAKLSIELGKTTTGAPPVAGSGGDYDRVTTTSDVSLDGDLALTLDNGGIQTNDVFFIIINGGANAVTGTFATVNGVTLTTNQLAGIDAFNVTTGLFSQDFKISFTANTNNGLAGTFTGAGNDVALQAVPEPSTWAMLAGGVGMLGVWQRSRRRRS